MPLSNGIGDELRVIARILNLFGCSSFETLNGQERVELRTLP